MQVTECGTGLIDPSYLFETTVLIQHAASGRYVDNYEPWAAAAIELSTISKMIVAQYISSIDDEGVDDEGDDDEGGGGAARGGGSAFKIRSFKNHKHNKTYRNKQRNKSRNKKSRKMQRKQPRRKSHRK
jgi:hypothetical protein